jgi:hypothetical protein
MCSDGLETANGSGNTANANGNTPNGNHANGTAPRHKPRLPYQSVGDSWSNTSNFKIIESTLREGEQFANAFYDTGMFSPWTWLAPSVTNYD